MWAVIATIFVFRESYTGSRSAAVSRMAATSVSFVLCLIYFADTLIGVVVGVAAATIALRVIPQSPHPGGSESA